MRYNQGFATICDNCGAMCISFTNFCSDECEEEYFNKEEEDDSTENI